MKKVFWIWAVIIFGLSVPPAKASLGEDLNDACSEAVQGGVLTGEDVVADFAPEGIVYNSDLVDGAAALAESVHGDELYDEDLEIPYPDHLWMVVEILELFGFSRFGPEDDIKTIIAALLHDSLEDTPLTKQEIENLFGSDPANMVDAVSKVNTGRPSADELATLDKVLTHIHAIRVKLGDRLANVIFGFLTKGIRDKYKNSYALFKGRLRAAAYDDERIENMWDVLDAFLGEEPNETVQREFFKRLMTKPTWNRIINQVATTDIP